MPRFLVERSVPHAGELTETDLKMIASQGLLVQRRLHGRVYWIHSMFTDGKMICLYVGDDETAVREHARQSGLPIQSISVVVAIIGPQRLP